MDTRKWAFLKPWCHSFTKLVVNGAQSKARDVPTKLCHARNAVAATQIWIRLHPAAASAPGARALCTKNPPAFIVLDEKNNTPHWSLLYRNLSWVEMNEWHLKIKDFITIEECKDTTFSISSLCLGLFPVWAKIMSPWWSIPTLHDLWFLCLWVPHHHADYFNSWF